MLDGASESVSDGFIDINDCPPIDTWFYMFDDGHGRFLYAWIPEKFIGLVNEAIAIACMDSLYWDGDGKVPHEYHYISPGTESKVLAEDTVNYIANRPQKELKKEIPWVLIGQILTFTILILWRLATCNK